jgi:uncharacterized protein YbjQ (UPF0145 family)
MILTTTPSIEGKRITQYLGVVAGSAVSKTSWRTSVQEAFRSVRQMAFEEMEHEAAELGANAVVGVDIDTDGVGTLGGMLMVSVNGTAVTIQ